MIDYDKLRKDLVDYALAAYFGGNITAAMAYVTKVESASNDELVVYARQIGFIIEDYKISDYKRRV